jgi:plastocyanin
MVAAVVVLATPSLAHAGCRASWREIPAPAPSSSLTDVAFLPDGTAWAVGYTSTGGTLALAWDGTAWNAVDTPSPSPAINKLLGVAARAPDDVWAVGGVTGGTLVEHWDGTAWTVVANSYPPGGANLLDVSASPAGGVWAVGWIAGPTGLQTALVQRLDGTPTAIAPAPGTWSVLDAVSALSPTDVWAAGSLLQHWDGVRWSAYPSLVPLSPSNPIYGLAASGPADIWATGLANEHWDGTRWSISSLDGPTYSGGVAAVSPGDVWAVGARVAHWDGRSWSTVKVPGFDKLSYLFGVSGLPDGRLLAVGRSASGDALTLQLCEIRVLDSRFLPDAAKTIPYGTTVAWNVDAADESAHAVVDQTGLDLYDSGLRAPGESFTFTYPAAGTYAYADPVSGSVGSVAVPVALRPDTGDATTWFTITWSAGPPPGDDVFDVQVRAPGSPAFTNLMTGTNARLTSMPMIGGPGTYEFRARVRDPSTGAATDWSPTRAIAVAG